MPFNYYPNYYQAPTPYGVQSPSYAPQVQTQTPADNPMIWVQGEAGAKAYPVAPNATVVLWDSERQTIYIKRAEASGLPSMRYFDYTERNAAPVPAPTNDYITRKEFEELKSRIEKLNEREGDNDTTI